ncbi:hypothetical protein N752_16370 [Desulforamulus aquiferis]|nr:hypothetical protein N752_16370 [Desulforamulus aquiferis]
MITGLIKANIGVYAAHTNLDSSAWGVNSLLAERIGLSNSSVLYPAVGESFSKLVVFIPSEQVEKVTQAICGAGAGWIGNYSDCTFQVKGTGTFCPQEGTDPYLGEQGKLEKVEEIRLETIIPTSLKKLVIKEMLEAHPYEEVAYDLYPLENKTNQQGLGRVGELKEAISFADFILGCKASLGLSTVRVGGNMWKNICRVAVCGGSGAEMWQAALAAGADVYVTGDIKYHTAQDMLAAGLNFIDAGHFATEHLIMTELQTKLAELCRARSINTEVILTKRQSDPFMYL